MHRDQALTICSPEIGIDPESNLGGAVYDRELLAALAGLGARVIIPLPRGEKHEPRPNWEIVETPRHRWKYYEYNLIFRRVVARLIAAGRPIQVVRAHSVSSTGPGLLGVARRMLDSLPPALSPLGTAPDPQPDRALDAASL